MAKKPQTAEGMSIIHALAKALSQVSIREDADTITLESRGDSGNAKPFMIRKGAVEIPDRLE